jgi:hypothetical protein
VDGSGWLVAALPALAVAVPTGREVLAFLRARRWARVVEQLVKSAKPGLHIRVDADGALELSLDAALPHCSGDQDSRPRGAP